MTAQQVTILVVEDREPDYQEWVWLMEDAGIEADVMWAKTAEAAVDVIRELPKPNVVVLDVNLQGSGMDGIDLCALTKAELNGGIDAVILTTSIDPNDIARAKAAGALAFLEKLEGEVGLGTAKLFRRLFVDRQLAYPAEVAAHAVWVHPDLIAPG